MTEPAKPRAVGLNHIAIEVGDIEEALAFYARLFRLEGNHRRTSGQKEGRLTDIALIIIISRLTNSAVRRDDE